MRCLLILAVLAIPSSAFSGECSKACGVGSRVKSAAVKVVKAPVRVVRCLLGK